MFIKLTLIIAALVPLINGETSESPLSSDTPRVGKFFGWFSVDNNNAAPLKLFVSTDKRWRGELSLSIGKRALIASEFHRYFDFRDQRRPIVDHNFQHADGMSAPANDSEALSATSTADTNSNSTEQEAALDSTSETTPITPGILKLEDYDEITFEPSVVEANRVRREASWNEDVSNRGLRVGDDDAIDSTTVESSTMPMAALQEQEASDNSFATLSPPAVATSQHHNFYYIPSYEKFPYPPSQVPAAQHVSITHPPHHRPYLPPVKNYYDFYPSQPDYNYSPYCMNSIHHKFTPVAHDAWLNYRKWK